MAVKPCNLQVRWHPTIPALCLSGLLSLVAGAAGAAGPTAAQLAEARRVYQAEREACIAGRSHQDRTTCLREAEAAYLEARRGGLSGPRTDLPGDCASQPAGADCAREGEVTTRGSVEGGGILREVRIPARP